MHSMKNQKGQGTTEYIVILALIISLIVVFFPKIRDAMSEKSDKIAQMIKTGKE